MEVTVISSELFIDNRFIECGKLNTIIKIV